MDKAAELFDTYLKALLGAIQQYGPDAAALAMEVGRIGAMQEVLPNLFMFLLGALCLYACVRVYFYWLPYLGSNPEVAKLEKQNVESYLWERNPAYRQWEQKHKQAEIPVVGAIIVGAVSVSIISINLMLMMNFYAWVGIFRPEVWLVYKAMEKML